MRQPWCVGTGIICRIARNYEAQRVQWSGRRAHDLVAYLPLAARRHSPRLLGGVRPETSCFLTMRLAPNFSWVQGAPPTAVQPFQRLPVTAAVRTRVNPPQRAEEQSR
jgi:hypothetical protein